MRRYKSDYKHLSLLHGKEVTHHFKEAAADWGEGGGVNFHLNFISTNFTAHTHTRGKSLLLFLSHSSRQETPDVPSTGTNPPGTNVINQA